MIMAQSLFMQLQQQHPGSRIDVLAPAWTRPLLERMPEVEAAIDSPFTHGQLALGERRRLGLQLRERRYQQVIILPNSFKSALAPFWAAIPHRTGYRGEMRYGLLTDVRKLDKQRLPMTVQRFIALGLPPGSKLPEQLPRPYLQSNPSDARAAAATLGLTDMQSPVLALCPGAEYGPAKRWPARHYAAVAKDRLAAGWQVWLFGSQRDQDICRTIDMATGQRCDDLSGRTSLGQAIDLMSLATQVISNDSGLMHVAAALDRPLVAIYGSSDPGFTPPLNERSRIVSLGLSCSPCFKRTCPLGHLDCLEKLVPEKVLTCMESLSVDDTGS
jgi:heptosyltransferase-2